MNDVIILGYLYHQDLLLIPNLIFNLNLQDHFHLNRTNEDFAKILIINQKCKSFYRKKFPKLFIFLS